MRNGYIYILINPALHKDLLKIGKTTRLPEDRAKEISSTGVPAEFRVAYDIETSDCDYAESVIHQLLNEYRYTKNREFFKIPLKIAIKEITTIITEIEKNPENKNIFKKQLKSTKKAPDVAELKTIFKNLLQRNSWKDECSQKTEMSFHRKKQLVEILKLYKGTKIPFEHFEQKKINDPKLKNSQIYPIICAFHMGYFNRSNDSISLTPSYAKEFYQLFPELAQMAGLSTNPNKNLLSMISQQQPEALYLKFIDSIEKIQFIENVHALLSQEDPKIQRIFNKKEITYTNGTKFGCLVPCKNKIIIGPLLLKYNELKDPKQLCRNISDKTYASGGEIRADFTEPYSEIKYAVTLLKLSLEKT